jgi:hypothetical protein
MADDLIHCPSCNHALRLPAELYGQPVECPQCHTRFTAPVPQAAPPPTVLPAGPSYGPDYAPPYADDPEAVAWRARSSLKVPAFVLLVLAGLGVLIGIFQVARAEENVQQFQQELQQMAQDPNAPPQLRDFLQKLSASLNPERMRTSGVVFLGQHLLTFFGAVQMLRLRTYWLAVLGCVVALNPINCPCCMLEAPFGLWGLIVLLNAGVRAAFR